MSIIVKIIKNAKEWRWQLAIASVTLLLITGINLVTPMAVRKLFSLIADNDIDYATRAIWLMAGVLFILYILRVVFQFSNNYFAHIAAWNLVAKMRKKVYTHMQTLSLGYYSDKQTGQLMSRVIEDTSNLEVLIAHALPDFISSILIFIGVLAMLFYLNPLLALATCIPLPFILFFSFFLKRMRRHFTKRQIVSAELNAMLQDNFSGMKEIQIFNRQEFESKKVGEKADSHAKQTIKGIYFVSLMHPLTNLLSGIGTLVVILFGGLLALKNDLDSADITVFLLYLGLLYAPVATFARVLEDIQTSLVSGKRIFEILDTQSSVRDNENAKTIPMLQGHISFNNVSFDYNENVAIIKNITFEAKAGQMVALVGATGAGKTTITSLLARFYDVEKGNITIDGIDIKDMTLSSLRNQMSMVSQDVFLFNGSIAENIAYGKEDNISIENIINAAKTASIHEYIDSLPDGYNTKIGERGVRLSGGQKQRIAIARAVLRNAPILILDEATSAVDNETEKEIQKAINALTGKHTIIVIAHRLSTIEKADKILVLKDGEIAESGNYKQLLEKKGEFTKIKGEELIGYSTK